MNGLQKEELFLKVEAYQNATRAFSSLALLAETSLDKEYYEGELAKYSRFLARARNKLEKETMGYENAKN